MFVKFLSIIVVISYLITGICCDDTNQDDKNVDMTYSIELTPDTFDNAIKENNHFVMFFAPWCGYCKRLHPLWEQLAEIMNVEDEPRVIIAKVDCTVYQELCNKNGVTGYPTLKFFKLGASEPIKFKGTRDLPTITEFVQEQLGDKEFDKNRDVPQAVSKLIELTDDTFTKYVSKGNHFVKFYAPWCSHCQKLAPTWEDLSKSLEYDESVKISKIDCTVYRPICQEFEVKGYPTLLWFEDGKKIEKYSGSRNLDDLKSYVNKRLQGEIFNKKKTENEIQDEKSKGDTSNVVELNANNFEHGIEKGITFVKFYAPWCGHCQKLNPIWEQLAVKMINKNDIKIAKVDCVQSQNKNLCMEQNIEGYPTLFIYKNGKKLEEYDGTRQLDDLYSFVSRYVQHDEL